MGKRLSPTTICNALQQDGCTLPTGQSLWHAALPHATLGPAMGLHAGPHLPHVQPIWRTEPTEHFDARGAQHGHRSVQLQQWGLQERAHLPGQWSGSHHHQQRVDQPGQPDQQPRAKQTGKRDRTNWVKSWRWRCRIALPHQFAQHQLKHLHTASGGL